MVKEEVNASDNETNPNNIKQEVPFEFVGIKTEVQVKFLKSFVCGCILFMYIIFACMQILMVLIQRIITSGVECILPNSV